MARRYLAALVVLALAAGTTLFGAAGAQDAQTPFLVIRPADTRPDDPNRGQWFEATLEPGGATTFRVEVVNPAAIEQSARLFVGDLLFTDDGTPFVPDPPFTDVGAWGAGFDEAEVTVPPGGVVIRSFRITAPSNAEPGDHVGAVVAAGVARGEGQVRVVPQVAKRLYITVPGTAVQNFSIREKVDIDLDQWWFPREATVTVTLRNTGRIRLEPVVEINKQKATGSQALLSRSVEPYFATVSVPFWGGPMRYRIVATTKAGGLDGPSRQISASKFVIPYHLPVFIALLVAAAFGLRKLLSRRGGKYQELQADLRRIERILSQQAGAPDGDRRDRDAKDTGRSSDPEAAILAAMKQARRAGDEKTEQRLQSRLERYRRELAADATPPTDGQRTADDDGASDAVAVLIAELQDAPPSRQGALIRALRALGPEALAARSDLLAQLPPDIRARLRRPSEGRSRRTRSRRP